MDEPVTTPASGDRSKGSTTAPEPPAESAVPGTPEPETEEAPAAPAADPVRRIVMIALSLLLLIYVYTVLSDRVTPYTSQAAVDTFLVQIAPEVTGEVVHVGVADNRPVRRGQVLFRIDRQPFEIALRAAEANLAVALQSEGVSTVEIDVARRSAAKARAPISRPAARSAGS